MCLWQRELCPFLWFDSLGQLLVKFQTKQQRAITVVVLLFFLIVCSASICTNMLSPLQGQPSVSESHEHAHHSMSESTSNHCEQTESCEWSVNPVSNPASDVGSDAGFFFVYLVGAVASYMLLNLARRDSRRSYNFSLERPIQFTYPRLHIQQAVFLN